MATPLREILARFAVQVDGTEKLKTADAGVDGLIGRLGKLGSALAGSAVVYGLSRLAVSSLEAASSAKEAVNVVEQSFRENADGVKAWAKANSEAFGRSESDFIKSAGSFGAFLTPMLDQNTAAAAEMSTKLSELAVDLGSFFNAADSDALTALRAGLVGETEPMRKFGVTIMDATLQTFAHEQGIRKKLKAMSQAEKVQLRYRYILAQTTNAQGDFARTATGYANVTRAAASRTRELAETIGNKLIPVAEALLGWFVDIGPAVVDYVQNSHALEAVLVIAAGAAAQFAISMAAANLPLLAGAAGMIGLALATEELIAAFSNEGIWADMVNHFLPLETRVAALQKLINSLKLAWLGFGAVFDNGAALNAEIARQAASGEGRPGEDIATTVARRKALETQRGIDLRSQAVASGDLTAYLTAPGRSGVTREQRLEEFKQRRSDYLQDNPDAATDKDRATFGPGLQYVPPAAGGAAGGGKTVQNVANVQITVPPGSNRDHVREISKAVEDVIGRQHRETHADLSEASP